jgi:hypothetical protein
MLRCNVCGAENDDLELKCVRCRAFLQAKVEVLDLFPTVWGLIEQPRQAFRRIVRARRKNFALLLAALTGIAATFLVMWARHSGTAYRDLAGLVAAGSTIGVAAGLLFVPALGLWGGAVSRMLGGRGGARNFGAVVAFASAPIAVSLVLVFPAEVAIFGMFLFDRNPDPMALQPGVYRTLLGFDVLAMLWSAGLLHVGLREASGLAGVKGVVLTVAVLGLAAALVGSAIAVG